MARDFDADRLLTFVAESNRIEGIARPPDRFEVDEHRRFLALRRVTLADLETFCMVNAGARLRRNPGMNVRVGNHRPPPGGPGIETALIALLDEAHGEAHPYDTHCAYETLHPFMDGNGRSGRVLWAWMMDQQERPFWTIGFLHSFYYQALERGRRSDGKERP